MRCIAKEQFERENRRYPLTKQKFYKNLLGSITFTGLSKKKWTPSLSFRYFFRSYSLLISLLVVMLLSVTTTSDYHIQMTYSHNQKLNLVFFVFQQKRKLLILHGGPEEPAEEIGLNFFPKFMCSLIQFLQHKTLHELCNFE